MTVISQELEQSLNQYDEMQSLHSQSISNFQNKAPDMRNLNFQRSRAFEELKHQLGCYLKICRTKSDGSENPAYMGRVEKIIKKEKMIASLALHYRQVVISRKNRMQHGKKALKGYGNACISWSP